MQQLSVIKECVVSPYYKIISTSSTALANLDSQLVTYSSDNKKMVSLIMVNDNMEKKQYIRVFNRIENLELCCVDVTTPKMHGVIHEKSPFGGFKWSSNGDKILYVAEKEEKATEFFDASLDWNDANKIQESHIVHFVFSFHFIFSKLFGRNER
ncbi:unnamed protein product [Dracunculus medinensis]|uniref:Peptidase_S9_N domain-containing protein n=1 Tax=Dracunculus medinensis TaxID=318479 RepID=A0A0N4UQF6_DRAME|nr:unnamed protein product [Dracunculus medinensis]